MTQTDLARAMGRPVQAVNEIVNGKKAITGETAVALEAVLDIPAEFWMNLQSQYEIALARPGTTGILRGGKLIQNVAGPRRREAAPRTHGASSSRRRAAAEGSPSPPRSR